MVLPLAVVPRRAMLQIHERLQIRPQVGTVSQRVELVQIKRDIDHGEDCCGCISRSQFRERPRGANHRAYSKTPVAHILFPFDSLRSLRTALRAGKRNLKPPWLARKTGGFSSARWFAPRSAILLINSLNDRAKFVDELRRRKALGVRAKPLPIVLRRIEVA